MGDGPTRLRGRGRHGGRYRRRTPQQIAEGARQYRSGEWRFVWGMAAAVGLGGAALITGAGLAAAAVGLVAGAVGGAVAGGIAASVVNQMERIHEARIARAAAKDAAVVSALDALAPATAFSPTAPGFSQKFNEKTPAADAPDVSAPAAVSSAPSAPRR